MAKFIRKHRTLIVLIVVVIVLIVAGIFFFRSTHPFSRRAIRSIQSLISSFGSMSALAVVLLIVVSTLIPPLPLPVPLIEIAAGLLFGFLPGFLICWVGQMVSSILAFYSARVFGKKVFGRIVKNKFFDSYRDYLAERGSTAVLITRATLANPFNIISFLAGFSNMKFVKFFVPTIFGSITEALLFTFVGSQIRTVRIHIWYVFLFVLITSGIGVIGTYLVIKKKY